MQINSIELYEGGMEERKERLTLPEREKHNEFDGEEFEDRIVLREQLSCGCIEENQPIQSQSH